MRSSIRNMQCDPLSHQTVTKKVDSFWQRGWNLSRKCIVWNENTLHHFGTYQETLKRFQEKGVWRRLSTSVTQQHATNSQQDSAIQKSEPGS